MPPLKTQAIAILSKQPSTLKGATIYISQEMCECCEEFLKKVNTQYDTKIEVLFSAIEFNEEPEAVALTREFLAAWNNSRALLV